MAAQMETKEEETEVDGSSKATSNVGGSNT